MPDARAEALSACRSFIGSLHANLSPARPLDTPLGYFFSREGKSGIHLDAAESRQFQSVLGSLYSAFIRRDESSRRAVEGALQDAILDAVLERDGRSSDLVERLDAAMTELNRELTKPVQEFNVVVAIRGLDPAELPQTFCDVRFGICSDLAREYAASWASDSVDQERQSTDPPIPTIFDALGLYPDFGKPAVVVLVSARDSDAAGHMAVREAQMLVDRLNLFQDLTSYQHGHVYLPGSTAPDTQVTVQIDPSGTVQGSGQHVGPLGVFSFQKLREAPRLQAALAALESIASAPRGSFHESILSSVEWAGRATVSQRRQEAFLLYAISLEALLLPESDTAELTYRLSLRLAHILGGSSDAKKEIVKRAKDLYSIRSKIVHSGSYEVTDRDLADIRVLAKVGILRVLSNDELRACSSQKEAQAWFQTQALR